MEWISTQERLPAVNCDVLFTTGKNICYGCLKNEANRLWINALEMTGFGYAEVYGVTDWMALPTHPNHALAGDDAQPSQN
jgi:hypothetical protein